jgi:hypothetical protein
MQVLRLRRVHAVHDRVRTVRVDEPATAGVLRRGLPQEVGGEQAQCVAGKAPRRQTNWPEIEMRTPFGVITTDGRARTEGLADVEHKQLLRLGEQLTTIGRSMSRARTVGDVVSIDAEIARLASRGQKDPEATLDEPGSREGIAMPASGDTAFRSYNTSFVALRALRDTVFNQLGSDDPDLVDKWIGAARRALADANSEQRQAFVQGIDKCRELYQANGEWPSLPGRLELAQDAYPDPDDDISAWNVGLADAMTPPAPASPEADELLRGSPAADPHGNEPSATHGDIEAVGLDAAVDELVDAGLAERVPDAPASTDPNDKAPPT